MIYLDSSAILKLVRTEAETPALQVRLGERPDEAAVTGEVGRVEVLRVARRIGDAALAEARALVSDVDLVPLSRAVQDLACELGGSTLRTLEALHVASALMLGDALAAVVTYDARLASAARSEGMSVVAPRELPTT